MSIEDYLLSSYSFELPERLIAQAPLPRGNSRLMSLDKKNGIASASEFAKLTDFLHEPCLFVANNSQVIPARLHGQRPGGGKAEFLLLTPLPLIKAATIPGKIMEWQCQAEGLIKPAKKIHTQDLLLFGKDIAVGLLEHQEYGRCIVNLHWNGGLAEQLETLGSLPLPPYIRRPADNEDAKNYQTIYAKSEKTGSVAAPTAGLHFTSELQDSLLKKGHQWAELTLYVGYGTFSPVRCQDIREHPMHSEYIDLPQETTTAIAEAKAKNMPVLAVGTTSTRVLEGVAELQGISEGGVLSPYTGWINTFLYPGKEFRVVDKLITNFHLPESTLLMLVSALAGREPTLAAYKKAIEENFRFFSYGDAMLVY